MGTLANKRIVLCVTGGIAAYKSADLARRLRDAGAAVRVVMTRAATEFITPLTLQAVSGNPVHRELLDSETESAMGHIDLARWADAVVVAPASANFLARLAQGRADDLASAVCLATTAPVAVAPTMNTQMWNNPATQDNITKLTHNSIVVLGPAEGSQACGETGLGRMVEPIELTDLIAGLFHSGALDGLTVLVTAGPTWEAIDPVRGITNRSSGKMGYAVAQAAAEAGAKVTLISGPTVLSDPERVHTLRVISAEEMYVAVHEQAPKADIFIGVAAVCDYRPARVADQKVKKGPDGITIEFVKNPDIIASVACLDPAPFIVGFAAETDDLERHAREKLENKKIDVIAANLIGEDNVGIGAEENEILLINRDGVTKLPRQHKTQLARKLIVHIAQRYHDKNKTKNSRFAHR